MAYATLGEIRQRLAITSADWDDVLQDALDNAQKWIDAACDRTFEAASETRYYDASAIDPADRSLLIVDKDLLTVGTLTNGDDDATVLTSDQYWLWPRNETPKWGIKLKSDYTWEFDTDCFVSVNSTWGYSTTADDMVHGWTLRLAEWFYRSKDMIDVTTPYSDSQSTKMPPGFPLEILGQLELRRRLR